MKKKGEYKRLRKLWRHMRRHFKQFLHTGDLEALHQFRVAVKKIRSFLTLLESNEKNSGLVKTFKPIKKIFKSAGIIREAVLHKKQATEHNLSLSSFYNEQEAIQTKEKEKLFRKSNKHLKKLKRVKKALRKQLHPVSDRDIITFSQNQLAKTYWLLQQHSFTEELHNGRKMLKHLMYNDTIIQDAFGKKGKLNIAYIDELQEALGNWHDNKVTLDFFLHKKLDDKNLLSLQDKRRECEEAVANKAAGFKEKIGNKPSFLTGMVFN